MGTIRLIMAIEEVVSEIIGGYDHVVISVPPHNFEKINKIKRELGMLLSQGKEYIVTSMKTKNGIEYLNCLRTN